jgi:hypothetical protein
MYEFFPKSLSEIKYVLPLLFAACCIKYCTVGLKKKREMKFDLM